MKEFRCIIFSEQEAITALIERRVKQREPLPAATIQGLIHWTDENDGSTLQLVDDYGKKIAVPISRAELAAALVNYCLSRRIPMPMGATKAIEIIARDITLVMTINEVNLLKPRARATVPRKQTQET